MTKLAECLVVAAMMLPVTSGSSIAPRPGAPGAHWIGTWATSPQPASPGRGVAFKDQSVRLIVHSSVGGTRARIHLSNVHGVVPLQIGAAHLARRASNADILKESDVALAFGGHPSVTIAAGESAISDPVPFDVPPLSDLAVSLYFPDSTVVSTSHSLALQTNYVSNAGNFVDSESLPVARQIHTWPFLTGVDVEGGTRSASIVAFGSSTTDGDGSTTDANQRWPDLLAKRLQTERGGRTDLGVLNEGIIGNRLLRGSPSSSLFGELLGESGLARFDRDVLEQPGVRYVILCLGVNDILFPGFPFIDSTEVVSANDIIAGYRQLIDRAHARGVRLIGSTIPPFEGAVFESLKVSFYTPEREAVRRAVNTWILTGRAFDGVIDFDAAVRDPAHPSQLLPAFAAADHLHVRDAGNVAQANAISLTLFRR